MREHLERARLASVFVTEHVVAEGIETEAQRDHLERLGCTVGQGFPFARPMPPEDLAAMLEAQHPPY